MKIQIVSDTHSSRLRHCIAKHADVLILAGDIGHTLPCLIDDLNWASKTFETVLYVPGNHEFYGMSGGIKAALNNLAERWLIDIPSNVHLFDIPNIAFLEDKRVISCTLWSNVTSQMVENYISDYKFFTIEELNDQHKKHVEFLADNIRINDIVLTHHLPSIESVSTYYRESKDVVVRKLNQCFYTDLNKLILDKKPALWIHGHSHNKVDYILGNTRIVSNPYGYFSECHAYSDMVIDI